MAGEPNSIVLVYLRRMDEKLDRVIEDARELEGCMTAVEERLAGVEFSPASINRRVDRVELCLDRIEKRLDLVELPH